MRKVWFRDLRRGLEWKKALTDRKMSCFTMSQYSWKKKAGIPSGPGALRDPI